MLQDMSGIEEVVRKILERRANIPDARGLLVGISGIDGCGKGYFATQLQAHLALRGVIPAILNVDGWLNLPQKRFDQCAPAINFYENAIRLDQFFSQLVLPLRDRCSVHLEADFVEETASNYRKHTYDYRDVSLILVEGIFLFKPQYRKHFDLTIWIDCSFQTALARAIERAQEGLSPAHTIAAYDTIYFPAQSIHLAQDKPRENADLIFENDMHAKKCVSNSSRSSLSLMAQPGRSAILRRCRSER
jgi:uridine kinase